MQNVSRANYDASVLQWLDEDELSNCCPAAAAHSIIAPCRSVLLSAGAILCRPHVLNTNSPCQHLTDD